MTPEQALAEASEHLSLSHTKAEMHTSADGEKFIMLNLQMPIAVAGRPSDKPGSIRKSLVNLFRDLANKMSQQDWDRELAEERAKLPTSPKTC